MSLAYIERIRVLLPSLEQYRLTLVTMGSWRRSADNARREHQFLGSCGLTAGCINILLAHWREFDTPALARPFVAELGLD
jgi:hypothetical protein